MPQFQKRTYAKAKLCCKCGDDFTIKELPKHSNKCRYLLCPICNDVLTVKCREHVQATVDQCDQLAAKNQQL